MGSRCENVHGIVDKILTGSSAIRQSKTRKYIDSIIARYEFYQRRGRM